MKYCVKCVMPSTRPCLTFNEMGICSACEGAIEKNKKIDWNKRRIELNEILDKFRSKSGKGYDCIVPVSGGKDSIYQVHMVKNVFNMNPLCVTFRTDARTPLGEHNLQALKNIGVDHIDFTPNPTAFRKLRLKTFKEVGDCSLPDHLAIWGFVPNMAIKFKIPLVIWGENPDMEYGGAKNLRHVAKLNRDWMRNQDILKGKILAEWCGKDIKVRDLAALSYPSEEELDAIDYTPIFLGYYTSWDCEENVRVAKKYGFKARDKGPIMGLYDYADLDCMYIVIHHYFKWLKFGFNRVTDNASNEIRKGRMSREEAVRLVKEKDGIKPPKEYIDHFCKNMGISWDEFWEIAEKFRNCDIWKKNEEGEWYITGWIGGEKNPDRFPHEGL